MPAGLARLARARAPALENAHHGAIETQACLQASLASRRHAPAHALDTNGTLFLHLDSLGPEVMTTDCH